MSRPSNGLATRWRFATRHSGKRQRQPDHYVVPLRSDDEAAGPKIAQSYLD